MPTNSTILIIRHAEKPNTGATVSTAGYERAWAYTIYFQNFNTIGGEPLAINRIFAAKNSRDSERPVQTVTPLAKALGLRVNDEYADKQYDELAKHILASGTYDGSALLVCWHHEEAVSLAEALGVPERLPPTVPWPPLPEPNQRTRWPEDVFGWVLAITFDAEGKLNLGRTMAMNAQLMYNDCGKDPPGPVF
jgi:hypothetical protein